MYCTHTMSSCRSARTCTHATRILYWNPFAVYWSGATTLRRKRVGTSNVRDTYRYILHPLTGTTYEVFEIHCGTSHTFEIKTSLRDVSSIGHHAGLRHSLQAGVVGSRPLFLLGIGRAGTIRPRRPGATSGGGGSEGCSPSRAPPATGWFSPPRQSQGAPASRAHV